MIDFYSCTVDLFLNSTAARFNNLFMFFSFYVFVIIFSCARTQNSLVFNIYIFSVDFQTLFHHDKVEIYVDSFMTFYR